jgi:hypothetical protein
MPESPPLLEQVLPNVADVVAALRSTFGAFQGTQGS